MKYKILISGKNNTIIDDFFSQMSDDFEAVTTSNRYDDMIRHLSFYKPDVFVYCISGESRDNINQLINAKFRMMETRIPIVLIGAKESTTSTCLRPRFAIAPPSCAATDGDNDFDAKIPGGMASGSKEGFCASIRGLPSKSFEILAVIAGIEIGRYNVRSKRFIAILSTLQRMPITAERI